VGVGSLDTNENKNEQTEFYKNLGYLAKSKKVIISVIGIKGSDSVALPIVGSLGDITGGTVNINHPLELLTEIVRISQRPVVASSVSIRRFCPPGYSWSLINGKHLAVLEEDIGNATIDTDISCEFKYLNDGKSDPSPKGVPFQVQIQYVRPDRFKCLRIITASQPITKQREEANKHSDVAVMGVHTIQLCGSLASINMDGIIKAHERLYYCKKFLEEITANNSVASKEEFANYMKFAAPLDTHLQKLKSKKARGDDDEAAKMFYRMKVISKNEFLSGARKTEVVNRRAQCNDELSQMYYDYKF